MQVIRCSEVLEATRGKLIYGCRHIEFSNISTDSRSIKENELFIPIKGERFDGHDFIEDAFKAGAAGAIVQGNIKGIIKGNNEIAFKDKVIIEVNDTRKALRDLASYYRKKFSIPFVGITGSVGKTGTKDMVSCVLMQEYNVLKTPGNFNNDIGVPLSIFRLEPHHEVAAIEMGMNAPGEISCLTSIVQPKIAIITNIGMSHIGKLGSRQNILKAKMEIIEGVPRDGLVILNGDDNLLYGLKGFLDRRTVYFGMDEGVDYQAYNIQKAGESGVYFDINVKGVEYNIHIPIPGVHNIYNALASIAVGLEMGLSMDSIVEGIKQFTPDEMRLNIHLHDGIKIIDDSYNASPQSMEAALRVLKDINGGKRRIAVLGDMLELGDWTYSAHLNIGKLSVLLGIDFIITVGENGKIIAEGALESGASSDKVKSFPDNKSTIAFLKNLIKKDDIILIKGSRGMSMEEIARKLMR